MLLNKQYTVLKIEIHKEDFTDFFDTTITVHINKFITT